LTRSVSLIHRQQLEPGKLTHILNPTAGDAHLQAAGVWRDERKKQEGRVGLGMGG
jgi:hypothetical protein